MNLLLAHEAYRNGIDDGADGQVAETQRSVLGHINVAPPPLALPTDTAASSADQYGEVRALQAAYNGDTSGISRSSGGYDSSGDFWKLKKDGKIEWDGKLDLYDEEGRIIETGVSGSYSLSLAKYTGNSFSTVEEASAWMRKEYGANYDEKEKAWVLKNDPGARMDLQAQYEMQWKYIDNVHAEFGGSMVAAINAMHDNAVIGMKNIGQQGSKAFIMNSMATGAMEFATGYDAYLYGGGEVDQGLGYFNKRLRSQYESPAGTRALAEEARALRAKDYTDSNPMYTHRAPGGILYKVGNDTARVSTYSRYTSSGAPHGFSNGVGALAIDIADADHIASRILGSPVYTTQYEQLLTGRSIRWDPSTSSGYGRQIRTFSGNGLTSIYGHLQNNTNYGSIASLIALDRIATISKIYGYTLPPGTMIGTVVYTGHCKPQGVIAGTHLHFENRPYWNW
ncbi:hypothetical protein MASR2M48_08490 [Spirochaetota bacterium]